MLSFTLGEDTPERVVPGPGRLDPLPDGWRNCTIHGLAVGRPVYHGSSDISRIALIKSCSE